MCVRDPFWVTLERLSCPFVTSAPVASPARLVTAELVRGRLELSGTARVSCASKRTAQLVRVSASANVVGLVRGGDWQSGRKLQEERRS
jgi:hypothetical protein